MPESSNHRGVKSLLRFSDDAQGRVMRGVVRRAHDLRPTDNSSKKCQIHAGWRFYESFMEGPRV